MSLKKSSGQRGEVQVTVRNNLERSGLKQTNKSNISFYTSFRTTIQIVEAFEEYLLDALTFADVVMRKSKALN